MADSSLLRRADSGQELSFTKSRFRSPADASDPKQPFEISLKSGVTQILFGLPQF